MKLVTRGIHHVALVSGEARRTLIFYRGMLGFEAVEAPEAKADRGSHLLCAGGDPGEPGTLLVVEEMRGGARGRPGIGGVHHIAFGTETEDTLLMWKRWLTDGGVPVSGPYDRGYFTSIYFQDPDGQILEIATAGPGYTIDEPADMLGRELRLPPQRIVRGHRDEARIARLTHPEPVPEITPGMGLRGIHHVSGITDDLEGMGALLEGVLGLSLIKRTTNRDAPDMLHYFWARYEGGRVAPHSAYTLFGWPSGWKRAREGVGQTRHVAFHARDESEQIAWTERLQEAGLSPSGVVDRGLFRSVAFDAPDGQRLEIATGASGRTSAQTPA